MQQRCVLIVVRLQMHGYHPFSSLVNTLQMPCFAYRLPTRDQPTSPASCPCGAVAPPSPPLCLPWPTLVACHHTPTW